MFSVRADDQLTRRSGRRIFRWEIIPEGGEGLDLLQIETIVFVGIGQLEGLDETPDLAGKEVVGGFVGP